MIYINFKKLQQKRWKEMKNEKENMKGRRIDTKKLKRKQKEETKEEESEI